MWDSDDDNTDDVLHNKVQQDKSICMRLAVT
jgi:hypothetical protein